jgi:hypothetical protein
MANNGPTTKSTPNQPNAMETVFAHLEALVTSMASNMASQVKPIGLTLNDSSVQGFDPRFFYGVRFLGALGAKGIESVIPNDHVLRVAGDKTLITVLITAPITRASVRM